MYLDTDTLYWFTEVPVPKYENVPQLVIYSILISWQIWSSETSTVQLLLYF